MQRLAAILLRGLQGLFRFLPFALLYRLSDGLFLLLYHGVRYRRGVVRANLGRSFPRQSPAELRTIERRFYRSLCDLLLESLKICSLPKAELVERFRCCNPDCFEPFLKAGRSALVVGGHLGNWEWGALAFPAQVPHPVVGLFKPLRNRHVEALLNRCRESHGLHLVPLPQTARALARWKNRPAIWVLIADQTPVDVQNAHWTTFLHQDTPFLPGADKIARKMDWPVFYYEVRRLGRGRYEFEFQLLTPTPRTLPPGGVTQLFALALEASIRRHPPDWLWSHRRWKRARRNLPGEKRKEKGGA